MGAKHKNSGAEIVMVISVGRQELADLARNAAHHAHGNAWNSPGKARFEGSASDRLDFSVQAPGPLKRELMAFRMRVAPGQHAGTQEVRVSIASFKTMQSKFLGLVPMGPKKLLGFAAYRSFMDGLASGVQSKDPLAAVSVPGIV